MKYGPSVRMSAQQMRFQRDPVKRARQIGATPWLIIKGTRISCPPQYGHRGPQGVPRTLGEKHGFEHGFPLIRSLRASAQRLTSVLFSFVHSSIVAASFTIRQSKRVTVASMNSDISDES